MRMARLALLLAICATLSAQAVPNIQDGNRGLLAVYMDTSANGLAIQRWFYKGGVDHRITPKQIMDGIMFAESSWGLNGYSKDSSGVNVGWLQNKLSVVVAREQAKRKGPVDTAFIEKMLLHNRVYDFKNGTQTFLEMFRHHYNLKRRGDRLLKATIRSYNAGHRRKKYMSHAATLYRDTVLIIATAGREY